MTRIGLACLAALVCTAALAAPAGAKPIRMTHTVSIKGELVDHWTYDEPGACGVVGDGTVTVKFHTTQTLPVLPYIDPYNRTEFGHYGLWIVAVTIGANRDHVTGMPDLEAGGTITRVDNTTRRPQDPEITSPCPDLDKSGCGTVPLRPGRRHTSAGIGRVDKRRISVTLGSEHFQHPKGKCGAGQMEFWSDHTYSGGLATGELPVKMPTPSALKHRQVTRASGTSHKRTAFHDPGDESTSDDVTRSATVTFRRR
jgi:hypothetical protein